MMYMVVNKPSEISIGQYLPATDLDAIGHEQRSLPITIFHQHLQRILLSSKSLPQLCNGLPANVISVTTLDEFKLLVGAIMLIA